MGRKLAIDPRQIEHRCNRTHLVIVRHHLFKAERIKQLRLILLQPTHHGPFPPLTASTSENHCSRKPSTDFCNKIRQERSFIDNHHLRSKYFRTCDHGSEPPLDDGNESSDDFRCTPDSGHRRPSRPCPKSANKRLS